MNQRVVLCLLSLFLMVTKGIALVRLEEGAHTINGVQLLQDYENPKRYYYLPTVPRLVKNADGSFQLMCLKYVDVGGKSSGGLFHALFDFTLPEDTIKDLEKALRKRVSNAQIIGMIPLTPSGNGSGTPQSGFEIISAVLKNQSFTQSLISSGQAPLTQGSRAAIAAILTPPGATLLFDSLTSPTSDVSVAISGSYEAAVVGFSAHITAEVDSVYRHFSEFRNQQSGFSRETLKQRVDEMRNSGILKVEVLDRSSTQSGFKTNEMNAIVEVLTQRIADSMFTVKAGLEPVAAGEDVNLTIPGKESLGFLETTLLGSSNQRYVTDQQYILKKRSDIRQARFEVILNKSGTVRVPVYSAGNLSVQHDALKDDPRYFRVVNLADPSFDVREVFFQVDPEIASAFAERINFVTVTMRKLHTNNPETVQQLTFTANEVTGGNGPSALKYPRLGDTTDEWLSYDYRVTWSFRGRESFTFPAANGWQKSDQHMQILAPPVEKSRIGMEGDKSQWIAAGIVAVNVEIQTTMLGLPSEQRLLLRTLDTDLSKEVKIFSDPGTKYKLKKTWQFKDGKQVTQTDEPSDLLYVNLRAPNL